MINRTVKLIALILTVAALVSLCACASSNPEMEAASGTYKYYAVKIGDSYFAVPEQENQTTTLDANGGGSLYWGEDNKGPITKWSIDGEKVKIKAGISDMDATLKDGILVIEISDSDDLQMSCVFIKEGADTSGMPLTSLEEYASEYQE